MKLQPTAHETLQLSVNSQQVTKGLFTVVISVNCVILSRCVNRQQLRSSARLRDMAPCSRRNWAIEYLCWLIMTLGSHAIITGVIPTMQGVFLIRSATSDCQDGSTSVIAPSLR